MTVKDKVPGPHGMGCTCALCSVDDLHPDRIDQVVASWRDANPGLDCDIKSLTLRIRSLSRLLEKALRKDLLDADGVEMWEFETLMALKMTKEGCTGAGQLCRQMGVTSGAITNRLGRLEALGWIVREVDPTDRRQVRVRLTPEGRERAAYLSRIKNQAEESFYADVPREDIVQANADIKRLLGIVSPRQLPAADYDD